VNLAPPHTTYFRSPDIHYWLSARWISAIALGSRLAGRTGHDGLRLSEGCRWMPCRTFPPGRRPRSDGARVRRALAAEGDHAAGPRDFLHRWGVRQPPRLRAGKMLVRWLEDPTERGKDIAASYGNDAGSAPEAFSTRPHHCPIRFHFMYRLRVVLRSGDGPGSAMTWPASGTPRLRGANHAALLLHRPWAAAAGTCTRQPTGISWTRAGPGFPGLRLWRPIRPRRSTWPALQSDLAVRLQATCSRGRGGCTAVTRR